MHVMTAGWWVVAAGTADGPSGRARRVRPSPSKDQLSVKKDDWLARLESVDQAAAKVIKKKSKKNCVHTISPLVLPRRGQRPFRVIGPQVSGA